MNKSIKFFSASCLMFSCLISPLVFGVESKKPPKDIDNYWNKFSLEYDETIHK